MKDEEKCKYVQRKTKSGG